MYGMSACMMPVCLMSIYATPLRKPFSMLTDSCLSPQAKLLGYCVKNGNLTGKITAVYCVLGNYRVVYKLVFQALL